MWEDLWQTLSACAAVLHGKSTSVIHCITNKKEWDAAKVTKQLSSRSYEVQNSHGKILRRHRRFLRKTRAEHNHDALPGQSSNEVMVAEPSGEPQTPHEVPERIEARTSNAVNTSTQTTTEGKVTQPTTRTRSGREIIKSSRYIKIFFAVFE